MQKISFHKQEESWKFVASKRRRRRRAITIIWWSVELLYKRRTTSVRENRIEFNSCGKVFKIHFSLNIFSDSVNHSYIDKLLEKKILIEK